MSCLKCCKGQSFVCISPFWKIQLCFRKKLSLLPALFVPKENSTLRYLNLMSNDIGTSGAELIAGALHVSICLGDLDNGISFGISAFDDQYWLSCQHQSWLKGASVFAPFSMLLCHRDCLFSQGTLQKSDFTQEKVALCCH